MRANFDMETAVIKMGDAEVLIDMLDNAIVEGNREYAERGIAMLKSLFADRYSQLVNCVGGSANA